MGFGVVVKGEDGERGGRPRGQSPRDGKIFNPYPTNVENRVSS